MLAALIGPLVARVLASPAPTDQRLLTGFQYIHVTPPSYEGRQDTYGFGAFLVEELRKDRSWIVLADLKSVETDRQKLSQTVLCQLGHDQQGAVLSFYDAAGNPLATFGSSGSSWTSALNAQYAPWALNAADDVRSNIKRALKKVRQARPRFYANHTVDLVSVFKGIERTDLTPEQLTTYLSDKASTLAPVEGIWAEQEGNYHLAIIRKAGAVGDQFVAIVLETKNVLWEPGMIKARLSPTAYPDTFVARLGMGNHTDVGSTAKLSGDLLSFPVRHEETDSVVNYLRVGRPATAVQPPTEQTSTGRTVAVSSGTGFLCRPDLIATNYHVVENGSRWEVLFPSRQETFALELVVSDRANDLAVLRILPKAGERLAHKPLRIADSGARIGDELYTIGFPLSTVLGGGHKVATGVLSALTGIQNDPTKFQLTVPTQPGNSGGPVINARGEVVGVLTEVLDAGAIYQSIGHVPQNVNFAIKSDYLSLLLRQASPASADMLDVAALPRADQVERAMHAVGQIRTYK